MEEKKQELTEHLELSKQPSAETVPCNTDDKECTARWIQACCDCD